MRYCIIILLFLSCAISYAQKKRIDLNSGWEFRRTGDSVWYPATVPGCVHTDLLNNHLIPDPFYRDNEKQLQWIENEDWEYRKVFEIENVPADTERAEIVFEGLDVLPHVDLNGKLLFNTNNAFVTQTNRYPLSLKKGSNEIRIRFDSQVKAMKNANKNPELPGGDQIYLRKPAYQFGWDWAPRYVTTGIWKNVYLLQYNDAIIHNCHYTILTLDENHALVGIGLDIFNICYNFKYKISIKDRITGHILKQYSVLYQSTSNDRINASTDKILEIDEPKLWWCNGLGEPYLYDLEITLSLNEKIIDKIPLKLGLRKIELVNNKKEGFFFKLNGVPVYMKGANYVPMSSFPANVKKHDHERLINDAVKCNFNMLRVWGGGYYESDDFYDLCDEKGILVWQDFMFACAMYPGYNFFIDNVMNEAHDNVVRLKNHPCISLWCGNNEIDEGWNNWGWQEQFKYSKNDSSKIWNDYLKLFEDILPSYVRGNSHVTPYIPSSPKIGWGHPEAMTEGDSHYWGVWWGMESFEMYEKKVPRFMSEFGFQAFPDKRTINQFTLPEDRYLYSDVMKAHQKHPTGYETINTYMEREYKKPKDFDSYAYVSQLLQAYGVTRAIEAERRAKPYCMGSLYWQLNDCWPVVSWSSIDYYGRWKALQYFTKQLYDDILVSTTEEKNDIRIYVVSDKLIKSNGTLNIALKNFEGKELFKDSLEVNIKSNSSGVYYSISKNDLLKYGKSNEIYLKAEFTDYSGTSPRTYNSFHYFALPKDLNLAKPDIKFRINKSGEFTILHLKSNKLVKNVHFDFGDIDVKPSSDYFDMEAGLEYDVLLNNTATAEELTKQIKIISLVDSF